MLLNVGCVADAGTPTILPRIEVVMPYNINGLKFDCLRDFIAHGFIHRGYNDRRTSAEIIIDVKNGDTVARVSPQDREMGFFAFNNQLSSDQLEAASWLQRQLDGCWKLNVLVAPKLPSTTYIVSHQKIPFDEWEPPA